MEELPDLTDLLDDDVEPDDEKPPRAEPPPLPEAPRSRGRVSRVDFARILRQHPPPIALAPEEYHRRPRWVGRKSLVGLPHGEALRDGVRPWAAYAASAAVGAALAASVYLGLM